MKTTLAFLLFAFCLFGCVTQVETEINAMHKESRATGNEVAPLLEELIQQKASINIQGRELTPEEIAFTQQVESFEATFAEWNKGMEKAESMQHNEERITLEQTLKNAIVEFKRQVMALTPPASF